MTDLKRWRGLVALINDAVEHGSSAIERVHLATARRPFWVIEQIPGVAEPTRTIHTIHDAVVTGVYQQIRVVNRIAGKVLDATLETFDEPPAAVGNK
jgi:hypothetical protein